MPKERQTKAALIFSLQNKKIKNIKMKIWREETVKQSQKGWGVRQKNCTRKGDSEGKRRKSEEKKMRKKKRKARSY